MTFLEHLEELRTRLIRCALAVLGGMIICWFFREELRAFLEAPLYEAWRSVEGLPEPEPLKFTSLLEPFIAYLKLSAIGGVFLAAPVILYNLWKFVSPGLYPKEKKVALPFVFVSTLLFVGGSTMAYSIVFPIGFSFFLNFASGGAVEHYETSIEVPMVPEAEGPDVAAGEGIKAVEEPAGAQKDAIATSAPALETEDAGVEDGGVSPESTVASHDAGVAGDRGPPPAIDGEETGEGDADAEEEDRDMWWEIVLRRILMEDCGEFEVTDNRDGTASLKYRWDLVRCKERPELSTILRGEEALDLEWTEREVGDHLVYEAVDDISVAGTADYRLTALLDPQAEGKLAPMLMVQDYLSFAVRLLLAFGIVFELPILITFLALAGIVDYKQLLKFSRWFIVIAVVFSAMLTPPDVITQVLLATPLIILYFLSIVVAYIFGPKPDE